MPSITVQIGTFSETYRIMVTTAPPAYDHGCTIDLCEGPSIGTGPKRRDTRCVLIRERDVEWSQGRYGSGLHRVTDAEPWVAEIAEEQAADRFLKGGPDAS